MTEQTSDSTERSSLEPCRCLFPRAAFVRKAAHLVVFRSLGSLSKRLLALSKYDFGDMASVLCSCTWFGLSWLVAKPDPASRSVSSLWMFFPPGS